MTDDIDRAMAFLDVLHPPMPAGYEDWEYFDMPRGQWLTKGGWDEMLAIFGPGNFKTLAYSTKPMATGELGYRGQFWISPRGKANCIAHTAALTTMEPSA